MARTSMAWLIYHLRTLVNDTASGVWTDDQLQNYLDSYRSHIRRELLTEDVGDQVYLSQIGFFEGATSATTSASGDTEWSGDPTIALWDGDGSAATEITPDDYNLIDGWFKFDSDQDDEYYLDAVAYDINGAVADCMAQLAMNPDQAKTWARGNVKLEHYDFMDISKYYRSKMPPTVVQVSRDYKI